MTTPRPPRCCACLTVPLPDDHPYIDHALTLQCERDAGHKGQRRWEGPITWTTPKEKTP